MKKEDVAIVAQLLSSMKDSINELEKAQKRKDIEKMNSIKKEMIRLSEQIEKTI